MRIITGNILSAYSLYSSKKEQRPNQGRKIMYDVIIIGAGVTGSAIARELSRCQLHILVVEKEEDVCCETSKANSGIVHSGIDCKPGTLKARMNILGNEMMESLSKELDFPFRRNGSLILCFSEEDRPRLTALYEQGVTNRIPGIRIVEKKELHELEPNISGEAVAAVYAPTGGIVCPFGLNIAMAENAAENGVEFRFDTEVTDICKIPGGYRLLTNAGELQSKCIVNAAGVHADKFHNMVSARKIHITPRLGEYCLLDKTAGGVVERTIFQLPTRLGKGVLVTPTVHGNILMGPTARDSADKESTDTTAEGLTQVLESAKRSVPCLPVRQIITSFCGSRAHEKGGEFILGEPEDAPGFFDAAGIESPGLTSAPAIGRYIAGLVRDRLSPAEKPDFDGHRKGILDPKTLPKEAYAQLIKKQPAYGNIICRCETVTEGEILDAIHRPLGARSLDGIKRRTRAGMGRCQSGFCCPKVMEILAREYNISQLEIVKSGKGADMIVGHTKECADAGQFHRK